MAGTSHVTWLLLHADHTGFPVTGMAMVPFTEALQRTSLRSVTGTSVGAGGFPFVWNICLLLGRFCLVFSPCPNKHKKERVHLLHCPSASAKEGRDEQSLGKSAVLRDLFILCPMDVQHRVLYLCSSQCRLHKDRQKQGLAAVRTLLYPSQAVSTAWPR